MYNDEDDVEDDDYGDDIHDDDDDDDDDRDDPEPPIRLKSFKACKFSNCNPDLRLVEQCLIKHCIFLFFISI